MIRLLRYEFTYSPFTVVCLGIGWLTYLADRGVLILYPQLSYMLGFFFTAGVVGAAISRELRDSTGGGYGFLSILPVTTREIVWVKFLVILFDVAFGWLLVFLLYSALPGDPGVFLPSLFYVTVWCLGTLLVLGIWYVLVYRFGFGSPTLGLSILLIGILLPFSLFIDKKLDMTQTGGFPQVIVSFAHFHWLVWLLTTSISLTLFYALFRLAVRIKDCNGSH